jgi:hypothetical protein
LTADPEVKCYLPGAPRATYMPQPFQIIQALKSIMIAYQYASAVRTIPMESTGPSPAPSWMGWSVIGKGTRWVVDVTDFNDQVGSTGLAISTATPYMWWNAIPPEVPPLLARSPGHMRDFIRACKGGDPACSNFDVAAPFVEWMLLGVIALRHEGKLEYDPDKMKITNNSDANKLLKPTFRKGWEFHAVKG